MKFVRGWSRGKSSVMRKLVLRSCLVVLLPALALCAYIAFKNDRDMWETSVAQMQNATLRAAGVAEKMMQAVELQTWQLLNNFDSELTRANTNFPTDYVRLADEVRNFETAIYHNSYIEDIQYYNQSGDFVLTASLGYLRVKNAVYLEDLRQAAASGMRSGWMRLNHSGEEGYFCYIQRLPLYVADAQLRDVAIALVNEERLLNELRTDARRFEGQQYLLLDGKGRLLCADVPDGWSEADCDALCRTTQGDGQNAETLNFQSENGEKYVCHYQKLGDCLLISTTPTSAIDAVMGVGRRNAALMFVLILFLVGGMALLFAFEVYRPLGTLVEDTRRLSLPAPTGMDEVDEYGYINGLLDRYDAQVSMLTERIEDSRPVMRTALVRLLLEGERLPNAAEVLAQHGMNLDDRVQVMCIGLRWAQPGALPLEEIRSFCAVLLARADMPCDVVQQGADRLCAVVYAPASGTMEELSRRVGGMAEILRAEIARRWTASVSVGIGNVCESVMDACYSYRQAAKALEYRRVRGENVIIHSRDTEQARAQCYYPIQLEMELIHAARSGDQAECTRILNSIFHRNFSKENPLDLQSANCLMFNIVSTEMALINDFSALSREAFGSGGDPVSAALQCATFQEFYEKTLRVFGAICENVKKDKYLKRERDMQAAVDYIDAHFCDAALSQAEVAQVLGMSKPALSAQFKQATGENMVDYISRRRVEYAKELLADESVLVGEASERAGFGNVKTMIRQFKHFVGAPPGEYRKQLKARERVE